MLHLRNLTKWYPTPHGRRYIFRDLNFEFTSGKNSGLTVVAVPESIFTEVTINGIFPCDGGSVDILGFCAFNNATVSPPYDIEVSRIGYLTVETTLDDAHDSSSVVFTRPASAL